MFTRLDDILYPNTVEVYDFHEINKFVYPIFKCGRSTITEIIKEKQFPVLINEQIKQLKLIDIYLRNPKERFISGVRTYLHNIRNENLDVNTIIYYIKQGIILDRHFLPQICWLINLARYLSPTTKLSLHSIAMLNEYSQGVHAKPEKDESIDLSELEQVPNLEMYHRLDQIILDELIGDSWTIQEIFNHLKTSDPIAYTAVIGKAKHVLSKI